MAAGVAAMMVSGAPETPSYNRGKSRVGPCERRKRVGNAVKMLERTGSFARCACLQQTLLARAGRITFCSVYHCCSISRR